MFEKWELFSHLKHNGSITLPTMDHARSFNRKAAVRSNLRSKRRGPFKRTEACVLASAGLNIVFTSTSLQTARVLRILMSALDTLQTDRRQAVSGRSGSEKRSEKRSQKRQSERSLTSRWSLVEQSDNCGNSIACLAISGGLASPRILDPELLSLF